MFLLKIFLLNLNLWHSCISPNFCMPPSRRPLSNKAPEPLITSIPNSPQSDSPLVSPTVNTFYDSVRKSLTYFTSSLFSRQVIPLLDGVNKITVQEVEQAEDEPDSFAYIRQLPPLGSIPPAKQFALPKKVCGRFTIRRDHLILLLWYLI